MATKIELLKYRGNNSSLFTGRPQGEDARIELKLDEIDKSKDLIVFVIPKNTTSFNPSFYLGLLFKSIKKLGIEEFEKKYSFEITEKDNLDIISVLKDNLDDGKRNALNTINKKNSFNRFFS